MYIKTCVSCGKKTKKKYSTKYCSNECQMNSQYNIFIKNWILGKPVKTINISKYIKRYLFQKSNNRCSICGWGKTNPKTKKVPLEIDHIDGNYMNNSERNLRVLCPNCHSLTPHFRNLNKGNGRGWRNI